MASSFVSTILEHAGQVEQRAMHEKVDTLVMKLNEMEAEICQLAESKYINFRPNFSSTDNLVQKVRDVQDQMSTLERKLSLEIKDELSHSTGDFHALSQELLQAKAVLEGLTYLMDIYNLLETSAMSLEDKKFSQAAKTLQQLSSYFKHPLCDSEDKINVLVAMKTELKVQLALLECRLSDLWKKVLQFDVVGKNGVPPEPGNGASISEMSVSVTHEGESSSSLYLKELVSGLHVSNLLHSKINILSNFVLKYLLPYITQVEHVSVEVKTSNNSRTLYLKQQHPTTNTVSSSSRDTHDPAAAAAMCESKMYVYVFGNLINVLENLHSWILHLDYSTAHTAASGDPHSKSDLDGGTLMSLLGQMLSPSLLDHLQKCVLAKAVPTSAKDLEGFNEVISATKYLQDELVKMKLISPDNKTLLTYVENVNMLYANKKSQVALEKARTLMCSDLHDTVAAVDDKPVGEWPQLTTGQVKKNQQQETGSQQRLSDNTFRFPKCRISATVQSLMNLAYETLNEATESSPECAVQMFYAVRSMFELFLHVVPTHHGNTFQMFPQTAALHHNNCMYISHHMMTLGHQFAPRLPHPDNQTFVDLIQDIRGSGVSVFMEQVKKQQGLLLECLDGAEGFSHVEVGCNFEKADKASRQVILQLSHLQKIWKPVLPGNIYKKAMGKLIEAVVEKVSESIMSLEDIAQDAAVRLVDLLSLIEHSCGDLMVWPGEVASAELMRYSPNWSQLSELKFILGASLSAIADRWAEGLGPLANTFSPTKLKRLVRALFQNTERRAHFLATVK